MRRPTRTGGRKPLRSIAVYTYWASRRALAVGRTLRVKAYAGAIDHWKGHVVRAGGHELAASGREVPARQAPQVASGLLDRPWHRAPDVLSPLDQLAEAEGLGSDLAVEGVDVEVIQSGPIAHGASA
jgi:hypothetical protein